MSERIRVTIVDGVADVQMIRADKMNALDDDMFSQLIATGERLGAQRDLRAVVLSGEGRAFCAGLDMGNFGRMASAESNATPAGGGRLAQRTHGIVNRAQNAAWVWRVMPVPVIAAVHGVAFGGGLQVALGADIRIVHPETRLSVMEIKWGLVPDMAGTVLTRGLIRDDVLRELTYSGRIFSGTEAAAFGFATRLAEDPRAEALALAREIAGKSPDAIRAAKRMMNALPDLDSEAALLQESVEQDKLIGRANQIEAVLSQLEKRAPRYQSPAA